MRDREIVSYCGRSLILARLAWAQAHCASGMDIAPATADRDVIISFWELGANAAHGAMPSQPQ